jgi:hypothetical protein
LLIHRYNTPILTGLPLHFTALHLTSLYFTSPTIDRRENFVMILTVCAFTGDLNDWGNQEGTCVRYTWGTNRCMQHVGVNPRDKITTDPSVGGGIILKLIQEKYDVNRIDTLL